MFIFVKLTMIMSLTTGQVGLAYEPAYQRFDSVEECESYQEYWRDQIIQLKGGDYM